MLRIERSVRGPLVVFAVSGRVGVKNLTELQRIVDSEAGQRKALNLKDLTLVDRHAVGFLARCEAEGTPLENCPIYVRDPHAASQNFVERRRSAWRRCV